ncbi:ABC transporter ATP-binding protein [Peptoniphilus harei]|uniref:ABC transporter ATP-binding protein n=1 Tax=Peptoniphilus harei TaxID=54005 RepID=UPI00254CDECF|nr:ABC transporter ATP-binding protein [Peptoniphilus harei]MDK7355766.1 ABC transporter ATP-binding protein [Peptoniphilus harei]MDK7371415.1 ABC transporter ATP-binding protein [Peptoniphilus harei]
MEILKVENLRKEYGEGNSKVVALDGVDLTIERGEFVAIVGPSGSGKSTLLHIIGGVDNSDDGKVYIDGNDISKYTSKELALFRRRKVGLIYQFYNLIPNLTVRHNIELPLKLDKRKINEEALLDIVRKLGIENKLDSFPSELSGGQQQRVAIARSLVYSPSLVLADEPTGNLDRENSREIIEILKYFNRTLKQTIIVITHDESIALEAERVITIVDGKIVGDENNE